ncbi:MAG: NAD-binding protein [Candidatus Thermoplasmatota archaeon]|nr:NAD-binding protein [Candidatus Thermoplasmatota archaeon]
MRIWTTKTKLKIFGTTLVLLFLFSTFGFVLIKQNVEAQETSFIRAIYWVVITLATLGYYPPEVALTSEIGMAFTVVVVISGVVAIFIGVPSIVAPWLEEKLRKAGKTKRAPIPAGGHIIVEGYSDTAKSTIAELNRHGFSCVVIDDDPSSLDDLIDKGLPFIRGDGSEEKILKNANIDSALGFVVTGRDERNIFTCLTAIRMKPDMPITAMARNPETEKLLYKLGASKVVTPKNMIGRMLAKKALGRYDADLAEGKSLLGNLEIHQHTISKENKIAGKSLKDSAIGEKTGVVVVGVWQDGELQASPPKDFIVQPGDILVAMGTSQQLLLMENLFVGLEEVS